MIRETGDKTQMTPYRGEWWNPKYGAPSASNIEVPNTCSYIADEKPGFKRFGDCEHFQRFIALQPGICDDGRYWSTSSYAWKYYKSLPKPEIPSGFNSRAFQAMKPQISPVIQAPIEIKELVLGWKGLAIPFRKGSNIASKAGSTNLWWQFGVAPTLGSIQSVIDGLKGFEQRLHDFLRLQGKPLKSYYSEIEVVSADNVLNLEWTGAPEKWAARQDWMEYKIVRTATMTYKYSIVGVDGMSETEIWLKALGDLLGVSRIIAMAWEATPWSFVVDWFFSVGDFLEQFDKPFLDTAVVVEDYCISQKVLRKGKVYFCRPNTGPQIGAGTYYEKWYVRTRCLPDYSKFGIRASGNFGTRQLLLGASLLVS